MERWLGGTAHLGPAAYTARGQQKTYLIQLERYTVSVGALLFASEIESRRGICFSDSIAALMALARGCSDNEPLDSMAKAVHAAAAL